MESERVTPSDETDLDQLLRRVEERLLEHGVDDAVMLRRVMRARELVKELDRELEALQRYFLGASHTPPS